MYPGRVVAVGGHESDGGRALRGLLEPLAVPVASGRELFRSVRELRDRGEAVCVVPMTLGRDAELVADAARTLLALSAADRAETVLAGPFGTTGHLVGWLRTAATQVPAQAAILLTAPSGDPSDDAELYRVGRLVRQYGRHRTVEVALIGGDPDPAEGVRRCRALGSDRVVLLPAAWVAPEAPDPEHSETEEALLSRAAVAGVLDARVREAWRRREEHGDDGLATGLMAADGHGHHHSHGHAHDGPHGHSHTHDDARAHDDGALPPLFPAHRANPLDPSHHHVQQAPHDSADAHLSPPLWSTS